jgi:sigma-B regulation protein RsbU (phosphoserine phosphatase)
VLVVDDNEENRDVLSRRLVRDGHAVTVAENGAKALSLLENEPYDLVLLDIMMPEMNGYETLARIRADARWSDLPVIMISSVDEMDSVVRCIEMGAEDYLPKPFNPVLLRARVGAYLEKKRLRDERTARRKAEQKRLQWEIEMAARVQEKLLPERAPEVAGLDLAGGCVPAGVIGGDYFDFLLLDDCHLGLVMADVEGKGMPAALVMAALVASLRSQAQQYTGAVARLAKSLNLQMHAWTAASKFVTLFYGCLDLRHRQLHYVNAGHNIPLLVRGATRQVLAIPDLGGPVLGVLPDACYEEGTAELDRGDVLLACTDGIAEAFNSQNEEFGEERLTAAVLRGIDQPAAWIFCRSGTKSLWPASWASSSSISLYPMMAFRGVRSSWLMLARNVLLARLAASAAWVASRSLSTMRLRSMTPAKTSATARRKASSTASRRCPASTYTVITPSRFPDDTRGTQ